MRFRLAYRTISELRWARAEHGSAGYARARVLD